MFGKKAKAEKAAIERHREARRALDDYVDEEMAAGITWETSTFLRLNNSVAEAEKHVPSWRH